VEVASSQAWTFRDGKPWRAEVFWEHDDALEAARSSGA
jgi:hypothetical protein